MQVQLRGLWQACTAPLASNFHPAWDSDLTNAVAWGWGAYVDRLEAGWLKSARVAGLWLARFLTQAFAPGRMPLNAPLSPFCTAALSE